MIIHFSLISEKTDYFRLIDWRFVAVIRGRWQFRPVIGITDSWELAVPERLAAVHWSGLLPSHGPEEGRRRTSQPGLTGDLELARTMTPDT